MSLLVRLKEQIWERFLQAVQLILSVKKAFEKTVIPKVNPPKPEGSLTCQALVSRFPAYLKVPGGGVACGDGWFPLLWELCAAISITPS